MNATLAVTAGPHEGKSFTFDRHDTFLVGRAKDAHLQLSYDDPYFSRRHFLFEFNPPRCRVTDLKSRNGIFLNGERTETAELKDGDEIRAGHTVFKLSIPPPEPEEQITFDMPLAVAPAPETTLVQSAPRPSPFPGYELGLEIARGGMGIVYRAVRVADRKPVAIKVIAPSVTAEDKQIQRFVRETTLMSRLKHPNIVRFLECGTAPPAIFLAMELVDGPDASQIVKQDGPLPIHLAVRIAYQVLTGLAHAHEQGVVHRDIKPGNVLVGPKGKRIAMLADFGLARLYDECRFSGSTLFGEAGGTPAYMAPEQATHFREARPPADQYAAAATLYNLLTARYPHDLPKEVAKMLTVILTEPPVPIRSRRAGIPAGLAAAIHKALAREPAERFPDVLAFRQALLPFAKG